MFPEAFFPRRGKPARLPSSHAPRTVWEGIIRLFCSRFQSVSEAIASPGSRWGPPYIFAPLPRWRVRPSMPLT